MGQRVREARPRRPRRRVRRPSTPTSTFVNGAVAGGAGSAAKDLLQSRLQANDPPDTFQAHAGAELTDYINAGQVEDVSALYDEFGLRDAFPADLVDRLTVDGKIYSVPSNIHRANVVWANTAAAHGLGPRPGRDVRDARRLVRRARRRQGEDGPHAALGGDHVDPGQPARDHPPVRASAPTAYNGLWDGTTDWEGAEVSDALADFEKLMSYTNERP